MSGQGPIHIRLSYHVNQYLNQHSKPPESIILTEIQYHELLQDAREKLAADGVGVESIDKFLDIPVVVRERCVELPGSFLSTSERRRVKDAIDELDRRKMYELSRLLRETTDYADEQ